MKAHHGQSSDPRPIPLRARTPIGRAGVPHIEARPFLGQSTKAPFSNEAGKFRRFGMGVKWGVVRPSTPLRISIQDQHERIAGLRPIPSLSLSSFSFPHQMGQFRGDQFPNGGFDSVDGTGDRKDKRFTPLRLRSGDQTGDSAAEHGGWSDFVPTE